MTEGRIRVLTMVESMGYATGGAERLAVAIASRLDPERFHSSLCVTRWDEEEEKTRDDVRQAVADIDAAGVTLRKVHRGSRYDFAAWRPIIPVLRKEVDVLHSHMVGSNSWAAILGRLCRVPVIVAHEHMWSFDGSRARHILDRDVIGRGCDLFLTVSEQSRRSMIELEGVNPAKLEALRNGIPDRPPGDGARIRAELGIGDEPVVGSVGLLREEKAFEVLVEAAKVLADTGRRFRLLIVGDGPDRAKIERAIAGFGLEEVVILTGLRLDVPDLLAAMDVAVCSSDWEGGPLSILEYMQAGLPVVATDVGGIPEMVTDGVTGRLVPKRDPQAMGEAIGRLLDDPDEAGRLGKAGGERQRAEYRLQTMVERVEERYQELIAASRRR